MRWTEETLQALLYNTELQPSAIPQTPRELWVELAIRA